MSRADGVAHRPSAGCSGPGARQDTDPV